MAGEDPKKAKDIHFFLIWGTTTYYRGVTNWGTLWKWISPDLQQFFPHFSSQYFLNIWFFRNYSHIHFIIMLISHFILNFLILNSHISQYYSHIIHCFQNCSMQPEVINKILHFVWSTGLVMWSLQSTTSIHSGLHSSIPDAFLWNKVCRCLL